MKSRLNERLEIQTFMNQQVKIAMLFKDHTKKQAAAEMGIDYKHFCAVTRDVSKSISMDVFLSFCDYCDVSVLDSFKRTNPFYRIGPK